MPVVVAIHGGEPRVLGEDFAGTAAMSRRWVEVVEGGRAVAVDRDSEALAYRGEDARIERVVGDVMACDAPCDVVFVGNFSIGYWHTRAALVAYLRHARRRLEGSGAGSPGVFICDTYGGEGTFILGEVHREHWIGEGEHAGSRVRYTWEQREADPLTGMVTDVLHFRVVSGAGVVEAEFEDAFVYEWRLWSPPELRDAMEEAGFTSTEVYNKHPDAIDDEGRAYLNQVTDPDELDESFIVFVVGRV